VSRWRIGDIRPAPSREEVAAIVAALAVVEAETQPAPGAPAHEPLSAWVEASRRAAQRAALQRGPWRLSGRIGRRFRT
jgi:hypothetical protein